MSVQLARQVADAIMFEGYVLYPYRASAQKNAARWQFGVLVPPGGDEPSISQTECLVEGLDATGGRLDIVVRFLQVCRRSGDRPWDEGVVCEVPVSYSIDPVTETDLAHEFNVDGAVERDGETTRQRWPVRGSVTVRFTPLPGPYGLVRLRMRVSNESVAPPGVTQRPRVLRHSLVATHSVLSVSGGSFVSMLEPPEWATSAVAGCVNQHTWPVVVGRPDVMLSSPIILYDYPEIAPESAGDMCDATEMDEMLVLRTMTLTDAEKAEARATDAVAAGIIDQADLMPPEMLERLHGAIRYLRKVAHDAPTFIGAGTGGDGSEQSSVDQTPWWDPAADQSVSPGTDQVAVPGGEARRGSKVRLRPSPSGGDAQDMFLHGRIATVQAVLSDVDGQVHVAVSLDDDPATDLDAWYGRYRYFRPQEVELVAEAMTTQPEPPVPGEPSDRTPVAPPAHEPTVSQGGAPAVETTGPMAQVPEQGGAAPVPSLGVEQT